MNQPVGKQAFDQAEKLFRETFSPGHVLALAEKTVTTSKEFYEKAAAAAHDGAKALTEIADAAWGSTKLLNEKLAQNLTANVEAAFAAAQQIAAAKSLPEIGKIQTEFVQKLSVQTTEQTKEMVDLSTRATQHLFEKAQAVASKSMKPLCVGAHIWLPTRAKPRLQDTGPIAIAARARRRRPPSVLTWPRRGR